MAEGRLKCANPECGRRFDPVPRAPHMAHCSDGCRNHHTYLRTVLPRRQKLAGKRGK